MDGSIDWSEQVKSLAPSLYRYFNCAFAAEISEDLVQETLLRLVKLHKQGRFKPELGSLRMWAYGVAKNIRHEASRPQLIVLTKTGAVPDIMSPELYNGDRASALRIAIAYLKPIEQEVILLLIDRDLSLKEISVLLDIPEGTIKSHIHRAKESLKEILNREEASGER